MGKVDRGDAAQARAVRRKRPAVRVEEARAERGHRAGAAVVGRAAAERAELLDDEDALAAFGGGNGREHARRAAAADDDVRFVRRRQLALRNHKCFHKL